MRHFLVSAVRCPLCDKVLNCHGATAPTPGPQPGDLTLCVGCGVLLTFGLMGELQVCTDAILASLTPEEHQDLARTRAYVLAHPELREG